MKSFLSAIIFIFLFRPLSAQDNPKEIFPLDIGNSWTYTFSTGSVASMSHSAVSDSGVVKLTIMGKVESQNSIRWQFFQKREYYHDVYSYSYPVSGWKKDSSYFELTELKDGNHELYVESYDKNSAFPYYKTTVDSEKIYRYADADSTNDFVKTRGKNGGYENDYYQFTFTLNIGAVKSIRRWYNASSMWSWARFYLVDFKTNINDPYLNIPQKNLSLTALSGTAVDTSIVIFNGGAQQLQIESIVSSDNNFIVLDYDKIIPPNSGGKIYISFRPQAAGNSSATITITSNSLPTPSTITLNGTAYDKAIIKIQPNTYIQFDGVPNGKTLGKTYSVLNLGNIDLKIDSIRIGDPVFTGRYNSVVVKPGQTLTDTVTFSPVRTSEHSTELKIYSNAGTQPNIIWLTGRSSEEINVAFNKQSIYFGNSSTNEIRDSILVITNLGTEKIFLTSYILRTDPGNFETPFSIIYPDNIYPPTIEPGASLTETIRFSPINSNYISFTAVHEFYSSNYAFMKSYSIELSSNIKDYLKQNYPNPFNSTTKISYQIGSATKVKLTVYDMLGREIAVLVDDEKTPGKYEVNFNGGVFASGIYFYRLQAGSYIQTKKFILMK